MSEQEPIIRMNLVCTAGHRHWSPIPEAFVGQTCSMSLEHAPLGGSLSRKCPERLYLIEEDEHEPA